MYNKLLNFKKFLFITVVAYVIIKLLEKYNPDKMSDSPIYDTKGYESFQAYLDKDRYSYTHILRYEKIFGEDYVSTGGPQTTKVCFYKNKYCN